MSYDKVFLTSEEQLFLMEMLELDDPTKAAEKFVAIMVEERANPQQMKKYIVKILKGFK